MHFRAPDSVPGVSLGIEWSIVAQLWSDKPKFPSSQAPPSGNALWDVQDNSVQGKGPQLKEGEWSDEGNLYFSMEIHYFQSLLAGKGSSDLHHHGGTQFPAHPSASLWHSCNPGPTVLLAFIPRGAQKKEEKLGLYSLSMARCVLVVICEGEKKSIKIWRWEINKCNYISGYQQQTPDKVPALFWCWGLADSVGKQGWNKETFNWQNTDFSLPAATKCLGIKGVNCD